MSTLTLFLGTSIFIYLEYELGAESDSNSSYLHLDNHLICTVAAPFHILSING